RGSHAGEDEAQGRVADQEEEPGKHQHDRQAHAFGGRVGVGLQVGQVLASQGRGLGGQAGAYACAVGSGQAQARGQVGGGRNLVALPQSMERAPQGFAAQGGGVQGIAQGAHGPGVGGAGGLVQSAVDPGPSGQGDDDQVAYGGDGVAHLFA